MYVYSVFPPSSFLFISSHCQSKSECANVQDAIKASGALHFPLDCRVNDGSFRGLDCMTDDLGLVDYGIVFDGAGCLGGTGRLRGKELD